MKDTTRRGPGGRDNDGEDGGSRAPTRAPRGGGRGEDLLAMADALEEQGRALMSQARQLQRIAQGMDRSDEDRPAPRTGGGFRERGAPSERSGPGYGTRGGSAPRGGGRSGPGPRGAAASRPRDRDDEGDAPRDSKPRRGPGKPAGKGPAGPRKGPGGPRKSPGGPRGKKF